MYVGVCSNLSMCVHICVYMYVFVYLFMYEVYVRCMRYV